MDGESMTLNLVENPHVPADAPVYVLENEVIRKWEDTDSMVCICEESHQIDTRRGPWTHFLTHYFVTHKLAFFIVIEQIMNFPINDMWLSLLIGYPYLFLVHLVQNVGEMSQKLGQNSFVTGIILAQLYTFTIVYG